MSKHKIVLNVNGHAYSLEVFAHRSLLEVLRDDLKLTGTKCGCNEGDCGVCTVLLNGNPVNSCLLLAVQLEGQQIQTIEGLSDGDKLHVIQEEFIKKNATQCGFCTPAMIMNTKALLDQNPDASEEEIKKAISGVLCRCTGYVQILDAIQACQQSLK
jgi:carbon-monoxide dehydrogenase small subunit